MATTTIVKAKPNPRVFTAKNSSRPNVRKVGNQIPSSILENEELNKAISTLPSNYNFEIPRTIWKIEQNNSKCVALQFPEGLLIFSLVIADILRKFTGVKVIIMGDVTYGACCVDDFTAKALGADFMVHYAHSCLIPVTVTKEIKMFYVLVDIKIDTLHFIETIKHNFTTNKSLAFVSTVQFLSTLQSTAADLRKEGYQITIPQSRPLSPGEILGCTAPRLPGIDTIIYLGDGRFHLEAVMIANPDMEAFRYNPYDKKLTVEEYDFRRMMSVRHTAITATRKCSTVGVIQGTLGRQGSPTVVANLLQSIRAAGKDSLLFLMSEIFPDRLKLFPEVGAWVQIACPRLSIDWGAGFPKPLITPYELRCALTPTLWNQDQYPMDFYAAASVGPWTPNHKTSNSCKDSECSCANPTS